jgi:hypothetical protein
MRNFDLDIDEVLLNCGGGDWARALCRSWARPTTPRYPTAHERVLGLPVVGQPREDARRISTLQGAGLAHGGDLGGAIGQG